MSKRRLRAFVCRGSGSDDDLIWFNSVDNPVAVGDQFAGVFVVELRHLATGSGEASEGFGQGNNRSDHGLCMVEESAAI
jgi:hypothetical protein